MAELARLRKKLDDASWLFGIRKTRGKHAFTVDHEDLPFLLRKTDVRRVFGTSKRFMDHFVCDTIPNPAFIAADLIRAMVDACCQISVDIEEATEAREKEVADAESARVAAAEALERAAAVEAQERASAVESLERAAEEEAKKAPPAAAPKKRKAAISETTRREVWERFGGGGLTDAACPVCEGIPLLSFVVKARLCEMGHVLAESLGGTADAANLRPICGTCNRNMGIRHMFEFKAAEYPNSSRESWIRLFGGFDAKLMAAMFANRV